MYSFAQPPTPAACPRCSRAIESELIPFCPACEFDLRYGHVRPIASGKCVYCEAVGKLSGEHVFGRWLIETYGRQTSHNVHTVGRPQKHAFWETVPFHYDEPKSKQGDVFDMKVSNVCAECNNGWMSEVHTAAKPLVKRLADGGWQVHADNECLALARWVAMIAINLECQGRILKTPQYHRTALMQGAIPDGWQIGFGTVNQPARGSRFQPLAVPLDMGDSEPLYMNNCCFFIERAVFHARSSFGDATLQLAILGGGLSEIRLPTTPLWPAQGRETEALFRGAALSVEQVKMLSFEM